MCVLLPLFSLLGPSLMGILCLKGGSMVAIGYARVSTVDQDTALQMDAMHKAGIKRVYREQCSGVGPRPELQRVLAFLRSGDVLVVWKVDRVARSLSELLSVLGRLKGVGASIRSLTEPIDTSTPIGEFTFQILGAVAQLERSMIRERVMAGQAAAKARGKTWGTPPAIALEDEPALVAWFAQGGRTIPQTALHFGVHECVVRRVIKKQFPPSLYSRPGRPSKNSA